MENQNRTACLRIWDKMAKEITHHGIKITLAKDYLELSSLAAQLILRRIEATPKFNLLLPTGTTPLGVYRILRDADPRFFKHVTFFNMDEYCLGFGDQIKMIPETHPASYRLYMKQNLFDYIRPCASYFPGIENISQSGHYDEVIKGAGGIDLCLNATGEDGHTFGFNFPGTPRDAKTGLVRITGRTQSTNKRLTGFETPDYAITIGLATGMAAKEILFLVSGERKAEILRKVIYAPEIRQDIPATLLRDHPLCHWIVDEKAACRLP
jgi:glucosamine-6-phosphate deaminase